MYLVLKYIHHIDLSKEKMKNEKPEYNNTLSPDIRYRPNREEEKLQEAILIDVQI